MRKIKLGLSFAGTALLVACATQSPTQAQTGSEKFPVPIGYEKAMVNGQERYCRTDVDTGSHLSRTRVCYSKEQLKTEGTDTQNSIQGQIQNASALGNGVGAGAPSGGR